MPKTIDMTNTITKNGIYVFERVFKSSYNEAHWRCKCPLCLREDWIVKGSVLRKTAKMCKNCSSLNNLSKIKQPFFKDIKNQRFGKLIALEPTTKRSKTSIVWKCRCDCGKIYFKASSYLINGDTQSCGCSRSSRGEQLIEKILKENNIYFEKEKNFIELKKMRFDFYVDNKYIIEFDGKQHFIDGMWEPLKETRKRDLLKNKYCFDNNIPIIRIPFDKIDKINYNELNLKTSNFILKKEEENEYYRYM